MASMYQHNDALWRELMAMGAENFTLGDIRDMFGLQYTARIEFNDPYSNKTMKRILKSAKSFEARNKRETTVRRSVAGLQKGGG